MTGWNTRPVRHIPEEEIHAYLDQALSRSQAVEIERHLSRCPACQAARDAIAALRDRTTDILAGLGTPPMIVPPAFTELQARHAAGRSWRSRWMVGSVWAAGLAGALLTGHGSLQPGPGNPLDPASSVAGLQVATPISAQVAPTTSHKPANITSPRPAAQSASPESRRLVRVAPASEPSTGGFANAIETDPGTYFAGVAAEPAAGLAAAGADEPEVSAVPVGNQDPGLTGLWRTIAPDSAGAVANGGVPLVPGFAVLRMRMQPGDNGAEVVAVDQLLESGELIRTISGPAQRVAALVSGNGDRDSDSRMTVTIRQADRMVAVTGPADALGSLLVRVNARRRY